MPKTKRKVSWDVVRVVAVLSVVVGHITRQGPIDHPELGPFAVYLPLLFGANTLLVVSAFFICVTVRRGRTGRWLGHRLARVVPPYLFAVVVTYLVLRTVTPVFGWYTPTPRDLAANLLMVQAWSPDFHYIDASYWTMPAQVLAFACAALLAPRRWLRGPALTGLLWALILVPVAWAEINRRNPDAELLHAMFSGLTLHRAALFGIGVVVYLWTRERLSGRHVAAYVLATLAALEYHTESADTPSTIAFGIALTALAAAAAGRTGTSGRWPGRSPGSPGSRSASTSSTRNSATSSRASSCGWA
ncbi:acyltransferase family protein [Actinokineospora soli]|uniref:Acyltransferase family protein n=1 Tax=Actinokineospora soli TaxID=1048753 RepID=A0ABW2TTA4_9PSEU